MTGKNGNSNKNTTTRRQLSTFTMVASSMILALAFVYVCSLPVSVEAFEGKTGHPILDAVRNVCVCVCVSWRMKRRTTAHLHHPCNSTANGEGFRPLYLLLPWLFLPRLIKSLCIQPSQSINCFPLLFFWFQLTNPITPGIHFILLYLPASFRSLNTHTLDPPVRWFLLSILGKADVDTEILSGWCSILFVGGYHWFRVSPRCSCCCCSAAANATAGLL